MIPLIWLSGRQVAPALVSVCYVSTGRAHYEPEAARAHYSLPAASLRFEVRDGLLHYHSLSRSADYSTED